MELLLVIAIYTVLGFVYAWAAGLLAKKSVPGFTGLLVMLLNGAVTASILYLLREENSTVQGAAAGAAQAALLTVLTRLVTGMNWARSIGLGVGFTAVVFGAFIIIGSLM